MAEKGLYKNIKTVLGIGKTFDESVGPFLIGVTVSSLSTGVQVPVILVTIRSLNIESYEQRFDFFTSSNNVIQHFIL